MRGKLDLGAWLHALPGGLGAGDAPRGPSLLREKLTLLGGPELALGAASPYTLDRAPKTHAEAIRAYAQLMYAAASQDRTRAKRYQAWAAGAASEFERASIPAILQAAVDRTSSTAPATAHQARGILKAVRSAEAPTSARRRRARAVPADDDAGAVTEAEPQAQPEGWAALSFGEKAATVGFGLAIALALFSPTRTAP